MRTIIEDVHSNKIMRQFLPRIESLSDSVFRSVQAVLSNPPMVLSIHLMSSPLSESVQLLLMRIAMLNPLAIHLQSLVILPQRKMTTPTLFATVHIGKNMSFD